MGTIDKQSSSGRINDCPGSRACAAARGIQVELQVEKTAVRAIEDPEPVGLGLHYEVRENGAIYHHDIHERFGHCTGRVILGVIHVRRSRQWQNSLQHRRWGLIRVQYIRLDPGAEVPAAVRVQPGRVGQVLIRLIDMGKIKIAVHPPGCTPLGILDGSHVFGYEAFVLDD